MDLKQYKDLWMLHMIDMWSRYTLSVFIQRKKPCDVIYAMIKNWVLVFGIIVALMTDKGGEFSLVEMREIPSFRNNRFCTTVGMNSFQNGLCERIHAVTDMMLIKHEAEIRNVNE